MSRLGARCALLAAGLLLAGCASPPPEVVPASPSPSPSVPAWPGLMAALARVDITPPPGPGLAGGGPEGRPAAGYRARLHARALVLQDQRGEAVVFVVADLPFVSVILHRRVAELVRGRAPIGADRLLLAATHTHSGPGHFLDAESYNRHGSSVPGYDPAIVSFLAQRIASAVLRAWDQRSPARVAWGTTMVRGVTRNRSVAAGGVTADPTLLMLRVDRRSEAEVTYRPAGALSIFAMHGTGNSPENDLWDADIQGRVARRLEAHVDSLNRRLAGPDRAAVHLFANGAEGDVSPLWSAPSRCAPPSLRRTRMRGSRGARAWEWVGVDAPARAACLAAARDGLDMTSRAIAGRAAALFDSLALRPASASPLISRAFMTLPLTGPAAPAALCPEAEPGAATVGGAEDVPTRYHRWRFLGLIRSAFEEGPRAARARARGCQAEKRRALAGGLRRLTGIGRGFPEAAQLAVVRIGGLVVAAVPAEATTAAGIALADSVRAALGAPAEHVAILGLANGFIQYVATSAEYRAQHYEGASTLYGPGTAAALGKALAGLARDLGPAAAPSPPALVDSLILAPGPRRRVRPVADTQAVRRRLIRLACAADGITAEWEDAEPGALDIAAQFLVRIERVRASGVDTVAWDDGAIEVRSLGRARGRTWRWELWWPSSESGRYRVVLPGRPYAEELTGDCATNPPANQAPRPGTR